MGKLNRAGHGGGGGGGGTNHADAIPPHRDHLTVLPEEGNHLEEVGTPGHPNLPNLQEFLITYQGQKPDGTNDPNKVWSYRGVFAERDGVAGISDGEEAREVRTWVERLPDREALEKIDADPLVEYHEHDSGDRDTHQDIGGMPYFGGVTYLAEEGTRASGDNPSADPASDFVSETTRANQRRIEEREAEWEALIAVLLNALACGNLDVIPALFDALAAKSGLTVGQIAAKTAQAIGMADKEAEELGKKYEEAYNMSDKFKMNAELQKLQIQYHRNQTRRDQLMQILRTSFDMNESMSRGSNQVHDWFAARSRNDFRWSGA